MGMVSALAAFSTASGEGAGGSGDGSVHPVESVRSRFFDGHLSRSSGTRSPSASPLVYPSQIAGVLRASRILRVRSRTPARYSAGDNDFDNTARPSQARSALAAPASAAQPFTPLHRASSAWKSFSMAAASRPSFF